MECAQIVENSSQLKLSCFIDSGGSRTLLKETIFLRSKLTY